MSQFKEVKEAWIQLGCLICGQLKLVYLIGIIFLLIQGISELFKSYWAAKKGEWPGETK